MSRSPLTGPGSVPTFLPSHNLREPQPFLSVDALAAHILRQRPGKRLEFLAQSASHDGSEMFPVVAVFALKPVEVTPFRRRMAERNPTDLSQAMQDDWIGWTCGDRAGDPDFVAAAVARVQTAGGLAA
ncbi:MAG: hypothetical protein Q8S03_10305 [Brevundimonas sp.]|uniref:hypothetical protein n=1 Tax=Brevundimonas sp. TaxID=1871086 RepID=UPI002735345C|nr:hypothetical protein [Brevundimonas sp.]MDP3405071.1 hypothetical protein [Brevundimonas sp.]